MKAVSLAKTRATATRPSEIREALAPHTGHEISINDYWATVPRADVLTDEQLAWRYLGFAVHCLTCDVSLSDDWRV